MLADLALDAIAGYRLTRLATADTITEPARRYLVNLAYTGSGSATPSFAEGAATALDVVGLDPDDPPALATLVTCRWCMSVWIAGGVLVARAAAPRAWRVARDGLVIAAGSALLAGLEAD